MQKDKTKHAIRQKTTKLKEIRKNYCTGVKIMISSRWSIYIYTYIEINTINATNIYVVDVCTKRKFYSKKALN